MCDFLHLEDILFIFPFPFSLSSPSEMLKALDLPSIPLFYNTLYSFAFLYSETVSQLSLSFYELALQLSLFIHLAHLFVYLLMIF